MRRPIVAAVSVMVMLVAVAPERLAAGEPSFGDFVKRLENEYDLRRVHIPLFFLAKAFVRVVKPAGVSKLELAVYEDQDMTPLMISADLQARVHGLLGTGWKPFVEVNAPRKGERVLLYMRQNGKNKVDLFIVALEHHEGVVLQARINPGVLSKFVESPDTAWRMFR